MHLSGTIQIVAPQDQVAAAMRQPEMLRQMIPGCVDVVQVSDTEFGARIEKEIGPVTLRLPVQVTVEPAETENSYQLQITGRSMIAGSVQVTVAVQLGPESGGTRVDYTGDLRATGLSARLLKGREESLMHRTDAMFAKLKGEVEAHPTV
jgi:uncharacterized protein